MANLTDEDKKNLAKVVNEFKESQENTLEEFKMAAFKLKNKWMKKAENKSEEGSKKKLEDLEDKLSSL